MAKQIKSGEKDSGKKTPAPAAQAPAAASTTKPAPEKPKIKLEYRQFRKRPVKISAFQWFPELGAVGGVEYFPQPDGADNKSGIKTLEGIHDVKSGDWIITGVKGELYPCDADIFAMTYEEVKEGELADPTKLPETVERNITWIIVRFANGDSFKIAAKYVAQKMVSLSKDTGNTLDYAALMRSPAALVKFASERMEWNELSMVALGYQTPIQTDRPLEWSRAFKTVEIEPEAKPEKKHVPPVSDIMTANEEEKKLAAAPKTGKKRDNDDDPDSWED